MRGALLGTGAMGAPMGRNLLAAGHELRAWNRTRERAEAIDGATVFDTPAEACAGAEVVVTMLSWAVKPAEAEALFERLTRRHAGTRFVFLDASVQTLGLQGVSNASAVRFAAEETSELAGYLSGLVTTRASKAPVDA